MPKPPLHQLYPVPGFNGDGYRNCKCHSLSLTVREHQLTDYIGIPLVKFVRIKHSPEVEGTRVVEVWSLCFAWLYSYHLDCLKSWFASKLQFGETRMLMLTGPNLGGSPLMCQDLASFLDHCSRTMSSPLCASHRSPHLQRPCDASLHRHHQSLPLSTKDRLPKACIILGIYKYTWYNLVRLQELFNEEGCEAKQLLNGDGKPYVTELKLHCRLVFQDSD
ncbi:hypothetical protein NL676_030959 [Syzygium grande]|nr:hypothetical protein NL676_030959 [Syzygium grande]